MTYSAFVIMPFSVKPSDPERFQSNVEHWSEVYESIVGPACADSDCVPFRDDEDLASRTIFDRIVERIESCDIVVCDLSNGNANVYLELGWALRAGKKVVLIKDQLTPRAFDVQSMFMVEYSSELRPRDVASARQRLRDAIVQTLASDRPTLAATAVASQRLGAAGSVGDDSATLLREVLAEVRDISRRSRYPNESQFTTVKVYLHDDDMDPTALGSLAAALAAARSDTRISSHYDRRPADAVYISKNCPLDVVHALVDSLHYVPQYIFDVDYPDAECGALSPYAASVGLMSTHRSGTSILDEPYMLPVGWWKNLSSCGSDRELQDQLDLIPTFPQV